MVGTYQAKGLDQRDALRLFVGSLNCSIDAIFKERQILENHQTANEPLYMTFLGLQKAFDHEL